MEVDPSHVDRMSEKGICASTICDRHTIISMCANITTLLLTFTDFDSTSITQDDVPFLHYVAHRIALFSASKEMRDYMDRTPCHTKLNYYVFNVVDRTLTTFFEVLNDEQSINAARIENGGALAGQVNKTQVIMAATCLELGIKTLTSVCAGAEVLKDVEVYENSVFHAFATLAKRTVDNNDDQSSTQKDSKRKKKDKNAVKNGGAIHCSKNMMSIIPKDSWPKGEKVLCMGKLRDGSRGCGKIVCMATSLYVC